MKNPLIVQEIQKQMELGISTPQIKEYVIKKGEHLDDYNAIFEYLDERDRPKGKFIIAGVTLIIIGLISILTARSVSGSLDFSFDSSGDFKRLEELLFKPVFAIASIVIGIIFLSTRKKIGNNKLRFIISGLYLLTSFVCIAGQDIICFILFLGAAYIVLKFFKNQ